MQQVTGVIPDMTVLAKAMSNGYPMGAVVGAREVMAPAARMFISSSYWSDNIGLVASLTTIRELKRRDSARRFDEIGESLRRALNQALADAGLGGACKGFSSNPMLVIQSPQGVDPRKTSTLFVQEMARRGIHCSLSFKATLAHTEEDIRVTAAAATEALKVVKEAIEHDRFGQLLVVDLKKEPFRRQVA